MKKILSSILAIALLTSGIAYAQSVVAPQVQQINPTDLFQDIPKGKPSAGNVYASALQLQAWLFGGNSQRTGATAPALTSCGTSPAISGNDYAGTITLGTGTPTGCVATFNTAYVAAPTCVVTSRTAPATTTPAYTVSTAAITITQAANSSNLYDYVCVAKAGG